MFLYGICEWRVFKLLKNYIIMDKTTSQFKVGDIVKILPRDASQKFSSNYTDGMQKYEGRLARITKVTMAGYHIDLDNGCYYWPFNALQLSTLETIKLVSPYELKNGDYIKITNYLFDGIPFVYVYLFKETKNNIIYRHAAYNLYDKVIDLDPTTYWRVTNATKITYATEEERKLLDNALLERGYWWNSSTKQLDNIGTVDIGIDSSNITLVDTSSFRNSIQKINDMITGTISCTKEEPQTETELNLFPKKKHYQLNFNY